MSSIVPIGVTYGVDASTTPGYVEIAPGVGNTFRINNPSNALLFVAVYDDETAAQAFVKPTTGSAVPGAAVVSAFSEIIITGNFGVAYSGPVYVCYVSDDAYTVVITPVRV